MTFGAHCFLFVDRWSDAALPVLDQARELGLDCLEIAIQAPTGSNRQGWRFVVVTDAQKRATIGEYYARSFASYLGPQREAAGDPDAVDDPGARQTQRVISSAQYLAQHMGEVPVHIIPCIEGRPKSARRMIGRGASDAHRAGACLSTILLSKS